MTKTLKKSIKNVIFLDLFTNIITDLIRVVFNTFTIFIAQNDLVKPVNCFMLAASTISCNVLTLVFMGCISLLERTGVGFICIAAHCVGKFPFYGVNLLQNEIQLE